MIASGRFLKKAAAVDIKSDNRRLKIVWSSGANAPEKMHLAPGNARQVSCLELFTEPDKELIFQ
jgi:hypothetical protein